MNETMNNNTEENLVKPVLDNLGKVICNRQKKECCSKSMD